MTRPLLPVLALALAALAIVAADATDDLSRPRILDFNPWSWLPSNSNRSPSVMDYFFPPSRTPKNSNLDPPADRSPPKMYTTIADTLTTGNQEHPTTLSRKSGSKSKITASPTRITASLKTKKNAHKTVDTEISPESKTTPPVMSNNVTQAPIQVVVTTTTARPTKHYTIRPLIRTTATDTVETESTLNTESDSTETVAVFDTAGTTAENVKVTPTFSTTESRSETGTASTGTESTTLVDSTLAEEPDSREGYLPLRDKPPQTHVKINEQTKKETVPLPAGSTSVLAKPTKYHYYPHNQHIYLLPECAIQQVCNAVYVRLNYTQPLCACPARYRDPCSASLNADDLHTTRLTTDSKKKYAKKAVTLVKTCEAVSEMRECRAPRDWSLLALQNIRTGKSHYLVICRCPDTHILEGPMTHDQPTYASVPGIRVYGMMCVRPSPAFQSGYKGNRYTSPSSTTSSYKVDYSQPHSYSDKPVYNRFQSHSFIDSNYYNRRSRAARMRRMASLYPPFPWDKVQELTQSLHWTN
ncbi:PREDICTED: uncharacterized protein LOC106119453 [Papilio xuthus]|uniref:Uncharacterized protein LOC106119453 n=1 Tax=Papilio xuthus TaxID=66420 RepID=A0AAJ7EAY2_PAPXU|nr:PREDICTED: uncharacterized protein LOC106119453 [Papilio xuthus]